MSGSPAQVREEINVTFRGIDVFHTSARELLGLIEAMGYRINRREPGHPLVPGLSLGFTRMAGREVPQDSDGEPLNFQTVLVGPEHYYDFLDSLGDD